MLRPEGPPDPPGITLILSFPMKQYEEQKENQVILITPLQR